MPKTISVTLCDHFVGFMERQIAGGRFGSASEVVHAGLRLLEEQEARLAALRAALDEGECNGAPATFDADAFLMEKAAWRG